MNLTTAIPPKTWYMNRGNLSPTISRSMVVYMNISLRSSDVAGIVDIKERPNSQQETN